MVPLTLNILISIYVDEKQLILSNLGRIQDVRCKILTRGFVDVSQFNDAMVKGRTDCVGDHMSWVVCLLLATMLSQCSALRSVVCYVLPCAAPSYRVNRIFRQSYSPTFRLQFAFRTTLINQKNLAVLDIYLFVIIETVLKVGKYNLSTENLFHSFIIL